MFTVGKLFTGGELLVQGKLLTSGKLRIMLAVNEQARFSEIVKKSGLAPKNVWAHLKTLEEKGFINKELRDGKVVYIPTSKGKKVVRAFLNNCDYISYLRSLFEDGDTTDWVALEVLKHHNCIEVKDGKVEITPHGKEILKKHYIKELKKIAAALEKLGVKVRKSRGRISLPEKVTQTQDEEVKREKGVKKEVEKKTTKKEKEANTSEVDKVKEETRVRVGLNKNFAPYYRKIAESFDFLKHRLKERAVCEDDRIVMYDPPYKICVLREGTVVFEIDGNVVAVLTENGLELKRIDCVKDVVEWCETLSTFLSEPEPFKAASVR